MPSARREPRGRARARRASSRRRRAGAGEARRRPAVTVISGCSENASWPASASSAVAPEQWPDERAGRDAAPRRRRSRRPGRTAARRRRPAPSAPRPSGPVDGHARGAQRVGEGACRGGRRRRWRTLGRRCQDGSRPVPACEIPVATLGERRLDLRGPRPKVTAAGHERVSSTAASDGSRSIARCRDDSRTGAPRAAQGGLSARHGAARAVPAAPDPDARSSSARATPTPT